ncbi:5-bromo-4-chloroindolyl phosphate hydrolysis protein [Xenorhabdus cabanillasii]|uniref:5-bromo-4-chloroindolyl phosphate hydrolysis protein n=1 Tax=Xenorhabdus cabanillasii TaxID=351673 RepID=A0A3D9UCH3_9GAMM|nr:5-bromo-4-chloroindolyl phosphate hydrolysis family protein [Xenorhabdus cabanillasii]REF26917.1 5-bromo-4-chloroindolyl phosphate hydrolysis protein [Xenorhabdus cabanillasii]
MGRLLRNGFIVDTIKAFIKRLLIHVIGLFTSSIVIGITTNSKLWEGIYNSSIEGLIVFSNYIGMVALWPPRNEHSSNVRQSFIIVLLLILCAFANLLPVFILLTGLAMLLIKSIGKQSVKGGRFVLLIIGCLTLVSALIKYFQLFPTWFCITYAVLLFAACNFERKKLNEEIKKVEDEIKKAAEEATRKTIVKNNEQEEENTPDAFKEYYHQLALIMAHQPNVSLDMQPYLGKIEEKTRAIIACMKEDERDIPQGTTFLNRYLPMIKNAVESFTTLKQHQANSQQFQEAKLLTLQSLQEMSVAFSEMHQNLLSNNVDDLMADLKSMNQLVRAQGFELKK